VNIENARIVFMGSPDFAVPVLHAVVARHQVVGVVTQPDRPAGRGGTLKAPAVKTTALALGLPVIQPEKLRQPEAMEQLQGWKPDVIVVAAFGQILRQTVLELPPFGCINVHASLLPRWRGAAPIQAAILAGEEESGVTIMKMDAGVDTGPILSQRRQTLAKDESGGSLFAKLSALGADLLAESLPAYLQGSLLPQPQPEAGVTYAPMLKKEDGLLDFTQTAAALERRVRAMHPWPGAWFTWNGAPLKVLRAHTDFTFTYMIQPAGTRLIHDDLPAVYGSDNTMLVLDEVQPAGRKAMPGKAFLTGERNWLESTDHPS
jgi:methionyl-tRNA formyltransferase